VTRSVSGLFARRFFSTSPEVRLTCTSLLALGADTILETGNTARPAIRGAVVSVWTRPVGEWLRVRARPVVGQGVILPIGAAARAELVPLALVVLVRVPNVQVKQARERLRSRASPVDHCGFLPVCAAARTEQVPLALVVVVRVPSVQVKQTPERLHLRSMARTPAMELPHRRASRAGPHHSAQLASPCPQTIGEYLPDF
jgi:hypothetical protein